MTDRHEHPIELLAEYVEGTLGADDLAEVERHLAGCDTCGQEVELASRAREALARLPEEEAPPGLDLVVRRELRRGTGRGWRIAGAAAVAAAVLAGAVIVGRAVTTPEAERALTGEPESAEERTDQGGEAGGEPSPGPAFAGDQDTASLGKDPYAIRFQVSQQDYTPPTLLDLGRRLAERAERALAAGYPPTSQAFYEGFRVDDLPEKARLAARCALQEVTPEQGVVPFRIEAASFRGGPVYVGAFLQGPAPAAPYDRLLMWVADRETCALLYYSSLQL